VLSASSTPSPTKLPKVPEHFEAARADVLAFTGFPKEVWCQIWVEQPQRAAQP
jgi:transposase-like protein